MLTSKDIQDWTDAIGQVVCCDCMDLLKLIPDKAIGLTVTSPPYDNLRDYHGYNFDFENTVKELYRATKDGGVVVWVVGDATINGSETGTSFRQALYFKEIGFNLHDTMIYEKAACIYPGGNRYNQVVEFMFVLSKGIPKTVNLIIDKPNKYAGYSARGTTHRDIDGGIKNNESFKGKPTKDFGVRNNVWRYGTGWMVSTSDKIAYEHPAIFPDALAKDHILSWSNEGDLIFDPMAGSFTTALAAEQLGRRWIACDISEKYCEIGEKRLMNYRAQGRFDFKK